MNQSNKILKFYKSFGYFWETKDNWKCPRNMVGGFIGPSTLYSNGIVHIYYPDSVSGLEIIKLPTKPRRKFPRRMHLSNDNKNFTGGIEVLAKIKTKGATMFITNHYAYDLPWFVGWKYAKEIEPIEKCH